MKSRIVIVIAAALTASCVHETRVAGPSPAVPQPTVWDRQIRNASDAGDGDYALKATVSGVTSICSIRSPTSRMARMALRFQAQAIASHFTHCCKPAGSPSIAIVGWRVCSNCGWKRKMFLVLP